MVLARGLREGVDGGAQEDRGGYGGDAEAAPKGFVAGLVANFIAAIILAVFLSYARSPGVGLPAGIAGGLVVGFLVWLGFILTTVGAGAVFEGRSGKLVGINLSYSLVSYLLMGAILGYWIA